MSDPLTIYAFLFIVLLLNGFGALYWIAKSVKTKSLEELETLTETKETVEKPWFVPLFVTLMALSSATIGEDVLNLIPAFSMKSMPLLKYILALGVGTIAFIGGMITRRRVKDLQS